MNKKTLKKIVLQEIKSLFKEQKSPEQEKSDPKDVERYKIAKTKGLMPAASKKINTRDEALAAIMSDIQGDIENLPPATKRQVITMLIQKLRKQVAGK